MKDSSYSQNIENMLNSHGYDDQGSKTAHSHERNTISDIGSKRIPRVIREAKQELLLSKYATRAVGAGNRVVEEESDPFRTCFEKDLDKIKHASSFRRLAGKCQVFLNPTNDMIRTRLTHSIEVAQIAKSISNYLGANSDLVEAIALAHDCGHGPGGHASEDVFTPYLPGGFDHAVWGADVVLKPLNLCVETLDGVRNHSWKLPAPLTPEASIVSWADRIAYVCHDFQDALTQDIVSSKSLNDLFSYIGHTQSSQIEFFIESLVTGTLEKGYVSMSSLNAELLENFRDFNYNNIYLRAESMETYDEVVKMLGSLVDFYIKNPVSSEPDLEHQEGFTPEFNSVRYVASMTDRFAIKQAIDLLGYTEKNLPKINY